ncbi:Ubiquitin-like-specific protease 2 [Cladobotryum mycophilum]|uniref:Ubiquitin-like-specific protease 2 n=1 Tax=Cladobotryum mycophilum TaxID=491253 RepID=A0ABR0SMS7_9HYPO
MSITSSPAPASPKEQCLKNAERDDDMAFNDDKPSGVTVTVTDTGAASFETQPLSRTPKIHAQQKPAILETATPTKQGANPVSSTIPEPEKLDSKTNESSDRKPTPGSQKAAKRSQDAYARYKSDANSFPDYGAPKHSEAMSAKDRMRAINSFLNPVNTLNSRSSYVDDTVDTPPAKRHKSSTHLQPVHNQSHYFVNSNPSGNHESQDAIVHSSQNDPYELQSVSSSGNQKPVASGLPEYRKAQPKVGSRKNRARNSRTQKSPSQRGLLSIKSHTEPNPMAVSHGIHQDVLMSDPESPDALTSEDPPPAMVISDISPLRKPRRDKPSRLMEILAPPIKRQKALASTEPIELSEDELQSRLLSIGSKKPEPRDMALVRAVCGKMIYQYDVDANQGQIFLRRGGARFEPRNEVGQKADGMEWLGFEISRILKYRRSDMSSRHILIDRSLTGNSMPKLFLEFESLKDAEALSEIFKIEKVYFGDHRDVERLMSAALKEAKIYEGKTEERLIERHEDKPLTPASQELSDTQEKLPKHEKIKDKLLQSSVDVDSHSDITTTKSRVIQQYGPKTRRSTRLSSGPLTRQLSPESWTDLHPDWQKNWPRSLVFPATGKNRATVDKDDISRLNEGEFLNDNLISFYLRYLQCNLEERRPELLNRVYIFSTFFFEKLRSTKGKINYDGVKAWTAKVDLLSYDYIVVPVNEHAHWYLAIICNAPNAIGGPKEEALQTAQPKEAPEVLDIPSSPKMSTMERSMSDISLQDDEVLINKQLGEVTNGVAEASSTPSSPSKKKQAIGVSSKGDPTQPKIITLDSLGSTHSPTCKALREYLIQEAMDKKKVALAVPPAGMTAIRIPEQDNFCDCGIFVLGYMREFLKDPDGAARKLLQKQDIGWDIRPSELRGQIRTLLFDLQKKQEERLEIEKQQRKALKKKSMTEKNMQSPPSSILPPSSPAPEFPGAYPLSSPERRQKTDIPMPSSDATLQELSQVEPAETKMQVGDAEYDASEKKLQLSEEHQEPKPSKSSANDARFSPDTAAEAYFSALSSPTRNPESRRSKLVVELKASQECDKPNLDKEPQFVQTLPSSDSETQPAPTPRNKPRRPSLEFMEERKAQPRPSSATMNRQDDTDTHTSRFFRPLQSIESDDADEPPRKPKYDGIDRSVDLTMS